MWRVSLAYFLTRAVLLGVLIFSVNRTLQPNDDKLIPPFYPKNQIIQKLAERVSETNEAQVVEASSNVPLFRLAEVNHNPFIWMGHLLRALQLPSNLAVVILSNLFFIWALFELFTLLTRITTTDVAYDTAILVLLWPTTYELSFGSSLAFTMWLSLFAIRWAMDDRWIVTGLALGALGLMDPMVFAVVLIVLYYFWYFSRDYPIGQKVRRALMVFGPLALALVWNWGMVRTVGGIISSSAIFSLFQTPPTGGSFQSSLVTSYPGQVLAIVVLLAGAVAAFFSSPVFLHRLLPAYFFVAAVCLSPLGRMASRVPLAALCLQGIAALPARPLLQLVKIGLFALSVYEILVMFGN